uniref:Uncharacterized protein n=1 Tax=Glossina brevipalpis TaxID=37001 RepID=A0A1A9WK07_9MUSC
MSARRKFKKEIAKELEEKAEFIVNYDDDEYALFEKQILDLNFEKSEASHRDHDVNGKEETFKVKQSSRKPLGPKKDKQSAENFFRSMKAIFIEKELKELKNEKEAVKINNQESSLTHLDLQTLKNNQSSMSEEKENPKSFQGKHCGTESKEITNRITVKSIETKFENRTENSVQITDKIGFRTANGKDISISEKGKKRLEGLLKELNQSASDDNT